MDANGREPFKAMVEGIGVNGLSYMRSVRRMELYRENVQPGEYTRNMHPSEG